MYLMVVDLFHEQQKCLAHQHKVLNLQTVTQKHNIHVCTYVRIHVCTYPRMYICT